MGLRCAAVAVAVWCLVGSHLAHPQTPSTASSAKKPAAATTTKRLPAARPPTSRKPAAKKSSTHRSSTKAASNLKTATGRTSTANAAAKRVAASSSGHPTARIAVAGSKSLTTARAQVNRQEVIAGLMGSLASPKVGIEGAVALKPFFDQLHRLELDPQRGVVRILQFGDSHTAADMFTGALRTLFQDKFGDGGAGFSYPGYPFAGYRIHGTKRAQSIGWTVQGTHFRDLGDGMTGLGGVGLSTFSAGSWVSLDADASSVEVQYLKQPGGGTIEVYDGEQLLQTVSTDGDQTAAGRYDATVAPGPHHFEVRTTEQAPVRLLGVSTENAAGVTYEAIGLNGAEASLILKWDEALQQAYMSQVNPALIVLSYGTNEASDHNWTQESYAEMLRTLVARCRRLAPKAAILVIGPADRDLRAGRAGWAPYNGIDRIVDAQRSVCRELGCAYWDTRARMGGFGSMHNWVSVTWAQADHTHFTSEGYTELASALFSDIVQQYNSYEMPSGMAEGKAR
jgi:lysophospholipase L1-like esterase